MTHHDRLMSAAGGAGGQPPGTARRVGLIAALVCGCALLMVVTLLIVGGIIYLVVRSSAEPEIATVPLDAEGFSTVVPAHWTDAEPPSDLTFSTQASLENDDASQSLTLARVTVDLPPESMCELLRDSAKEQGLAKESAEVLDPVDVDGTPALHYSWTAYVDDAWYRADAYCTEDAEGTVFLLAERNTEEPEDGPAPVVGAMLEEWTWD